MACELVPSTALEASSKASGKEDAKVAKQLLEVRTRLEAAAAKAGGKKTAGGPGVVKAGEKGKGPAASGKGGDVGKATFQQRFASLARDEQMLRVSHPSQSVDQHKFGARAHCFAARLVLLEGLLILRVASLSFSQALHC